MNDRTMIAMHLAAGMLATEGDWLDERVIQRTVKYTDKLLAALARTAPPVSEPAPVSVSWPCETDTIPDSSAEVSTSAPAPLTTNERAVVEAAVDGQAGLDLVALGGMPRAAGMAIARLRSAVRKVKP